MTYQERKHVVMFAAEASPFVKVGGLADVLGALPKVLDRMGVHVTVVLPAYQVISREKFGIQPCAAISTFDVRVGPEIVRADVSRAVLPGTGVEVLFLGGGGTSPARASTTTPDRAKGITTTCSVSPSTHGPGSNCCGTWAGRWMFCIATIPRPG